MAPISTGFFLGYEALGAYLAGAIATGVLMAVFLSNSGGAWDNAKKLVEDGHHGGKGSDAHAATVIGDTVGDPFKDTAGPSLNPLIKVMNLVAVLVAPSIVRFGVGSNDENKGVRALVGVLTLAVIVGAVIVSKRRRVSFAAVPAASPEAEVEFVTVIEEIVVIESTPAAPVATSGDVELDALIDRSAPPATRLATPPATAPVKATKAPAKATKAPVKAAKAPVKAPAKAPAKAATKAPASPAKAPVKATKAPVKTAKAAVKAPAKTPAKAPTKATKAPAKKAVPPSSGPTPPTS